MGRKKRHTSRTGDGGAELRLQKQRAAAAENEAKAAELAFYDDPSDGDNASEAVDSDGSEYGGDADNALALGADNSDSDDNDDSDDEADNDDDEADNDDDDVTEDFAGQKKKLLQMDSKWGSSKKNFYSADTAEFELDSDDDAAKDEEDAALELQRKQADMMDAEDFGFDDVEDNDDMEDDMDDGDDAPVVDDEDAVGAQLADISMLVDDGLNAIERVPKDFSKLSKKDKLQLVNQSAPELLGLLAELEATMTELNDVVTPAIHKLKGVRRTTRAFNVGRQYLVTKSNLMLNYIANISFYLLLRADGKSVADHPVLQHLLAVKKQMQKLEIVDEAVASQLQDLLTRDLVIADVDDGMDQFFSSSKASKASKTAKAKAATPLSTNTSTKKNKKSTATDDDAERAEATAFYEAAVREKQAVAATKQAFYSHVQPAMVASSSDDDSDAAAEDIKRGATYEIIKNKGLKAHKNKLNRNPRLKKRMQYRKAVIRRKGQVRDVRVGEGGKYGGETTGIKANLTRSRKIRN